MEKLRDKKEQITKTLEDSFQTNFQCLKQELGLVEIRSSEKDLENSLHYQNSNLHT